MFEDRNYKRTFYSAPQSVTSLVAAVLEPAITVLVYFAVASWFDEPILRPDLTACLLIFALTFPGRNRFGDRPLNAAVDIATSWLSLLAILALCVYATNSVALFDFNVLVWWAGITPVLHWLAAYTGRRLLRYWASLPHNRRTAVILGAGPLGVKVSSAFTGLSFMGYFDDRTDERVDRAGVAQRLGSFNDAAGYIHQHGIHEVYITLPLSSQPRIVGLLEQLQDTTASILFVPDVFGISVIQGRLRDMNGIPVVGLCETPFTGMNGVAKRASDLLIGSLILIAISPILLAVAIGVKLSSPGPAVFRQRRYGLDGKEIVVYKFRSMTVTEDGAKNYTQVARNDARVTRFGAFIRKTSLDELPQFINVIQGRMSIVGPRPHAIAVNERYRKLIRAYMVRHKVRPGITGWAQVNGYRGGDDLEHMEGRVEYDLQYLRNWTLGLDLQIIVRTIKLVLFDRSAY